MLASAKEPLHVEEITKLALESGLIETPEWTTSNELRLDIKSKQNNSAFRLVGNAIFSLNPSFMQEKLEKEEEEEIKREEK